MQRQVVEEQLRPPPPLQAGEARGELGRAVARALPALALALELAAQGLANQAQQAGGHGASAREGSAVAGPQLARPLEHTTRKHHTTHPLERPRRLVRRLRLRLGASLLRLVARPAARLHQQPGLHQQPDLVPQPLHALHPLLLRPHAAPHQRAVARAQQQRNLGPSRPGKHRRPHLLLVPAHAHRRQQPLDRPRLQASQQYPALLAAARQPQHKQCRARPRSRPLRSRLWRKARQPQPQRRLQEGQRRPQRLGVLPQLRPRLQRLPEPRGARHRLEPLLHRAAAASPAEGGARRGEAAAQHEEAGDARRRGCRARERAK
mmetsp:Transcript_11006/g.36565  ORF Transcript_11006/g.36565 Transcript_11006/m.36565 type:complete len:320 (-) Transcript_11006:577-1536(-)